MVSSAPTRAENRRKTGVVSSRTEVGGGHNKFAPSSRGRMRWVSAAIVWDIRMHTSVQLLSCLTSKYEKVISVLRVNQNVIMTIKLL